MEANGFDLKLSKNLHCVSVKSAYWESTGEKKNIQLYHYDSY